MIIVKSDVSSNCMFLYGLIKIMSKKMRQNILMIIFIWLFVFLSYNISLSDDSHSIGDPYNTPSGKLKFYDEPKNDIDDMGFRIEFRNKKKGTYIYYDPITKRYIEMEGNPLNTEQK